MLAQKVKNWGHSLSIEDDFDEEDVVLTLLDQEQQHLAENLAFAPGDDDVAFSFVVDINNEKVVKRLQWRPRTDQTNLPDHIRPRRLNTRTMTIHYHDPMTNMGRGPSEPSVLVTVVKPERDETDEALLDAGVPLEDVHSVRTSFRKGTKYDAASTAIRGLGLPFEEERALYDSVVEVFS